jgi:Ca2+-binding RTX toxin-like protein
VIRRRPVRAASLAPTLFVLLISSPAEAAPPPNDAFAARQVVPAIPFEHSTSTVEATLEPGEPQPVCTDSTERTVWYEYTPSADQVVAVDTTGSDFDTIVVVYSGSSFPDMDTVACADDRFSSIRARTVFAAEAGTTYLLQAGGYVDAAGTLHVALREVDAGVIAGTVTEEGTDAPLAAICVGGIDADFNSSTFAITDSRGRYRIPVRSGDYVVAFDDFCDESSDHLSEWFDNADGEEDAQRIQVQSPNVVGGIDAVLARACPGFGFLDRPHFVGTDAADTFVGTSAPEVLCGLGGNDRIRGEGGRDFIMGGAGRDVLFGSGGSDTLVGQRGADKLRGGPGRDRCSGGPGRDHATTCERTRGVERPAREGRGSD